MQKRGQVTLFILVGFLLVFAIGIYFFVKGQFFVEPRTVPESIAPVKTYVEACLSTIAERNVITIGMQGGYLTLPKEIDLDPFAYLSVGGMKLPYWYYKGKNRMPSRTAMAQDLASQITAELPGCLRSFADFNDLFLVTPKGNISTVVSINDEEVIVELDYPLQIRNLKETEAVAWSKFITAVPFRLGLAYDLAKGIMELENEAFFLEELTIDQIASSDLPFEGLYPTCREKVWSEQLEIKPYLQNLVKYNMHYLTFAGTSYLDSGIPYFQKQYHFTVSNRTYDKMSVTPFYDDNFGMTVDVYPSRGDQVKAIPLAIPLVGTCLKLYHHFYSVEYPLVFIITDKQDPEKPYLFHFVTPVLVDKNQPDRQRSLYTVSDEFRSITSDDYCAEGIKEVEVFAQDAITGNMLEDVNLSYQCVGFVCNLGKTKTPLFQGYPTGGWPSLHASFPFCVNGWLKAEKEGYLENVSTVTITDEEQIQNVKLQMVPLQKLDYGFTLINHDGWTPQLRTLQDNEHIFLTLTSKDYDFEQSIYYPTEGPDYSELSLLLDDSTYTVDIKLLRDDELIGGLYLENWTVTRNELLSAEKVYFDVLSMKIMPLNVSSFAQYWVTVVEPLSGEYQPSIQ
ncbi:hypothetical protein HYW21_00545 [Candidatus Woesearchaeota archaeon]|nr:hypothetical protein [Candidatus Woesearchaeota archaeon]